MPRPIALLTAQWADLPFTTVCELASKWGYDGLEIACWGDHFDIHRAVNEPGYVEERKEILASYNLKAWALANHLVGQAVCDNPIDERHQGILPGRLWGDGEAEGVRQRAAEEMKDAARAAAKMGIPTVVGFTGSSIWHTVAMFPPVPAEMIERGYQDFADRWNPILDVFDEEGVRFAQAARRAQRSTRISPAVGRPPSRMGFRLDRPRRRALGEHLPDAELHRIRALDVGGVGRRRDGSTHRRAGGIGVRPQTDPDRAGREGLRRGLLVEELSTTC